MQQSLAEKTKNKLHKGVHLSITEIWTTIHTWKLEPMKSQKKKWHGRVSSLLAYTMGRPRLNVMKRRLPHQVKLAKVI